MKQALKWCWKDVPWQPTTCTMFKSYFHYVFDDYFHLIQAQNVYIATQEYVERMDIPIHDVCINE
jgi:hypothetical protein